VHETLKSSFGRPLGLADKGVRLLDPAAGTGTFLLAAAQSVVDEVASSLGPGAIRTVLEDHVLRDFYGFELLPAPYTISHVKLALFARDHHVRFLDRRAPVYLTNTLGDPVARADDGGLLAFFVPGLIEEAAAAERVKAEEKILVVIGNPPWSASSHNKQPEIERLFAAWKTVDGRPGSRRIPDAQIALNDDYLKFLRWAVWKVVEQPGGAGHGIVAFVANHGFINGRIHRGIRRALIDAFDDIWVFNLQGNQRLWVKGIVDEKVFPDVQQGVALTVLVRRGPEHAASARVRYRAMRGTRAEKYAAASSIELGGEGWATIEPTVPMWSFAPADAAGLDYEAWPLVPEIFPFSSSGVQSSHDDLVADTSPEPISERMRLVEDRSVPDDVLRDRFAIAENPRWRWSEQREKFTGFAPTHVIPWLYRLFDRRYIYWDPSFVQWPRLKVMRHLLPRPLGHGGGDRLALIVQRARPITTIATVTRGIAAAHVTSHWDYVYPLRLAEQTDDEMQLLPADNAWRENLQPELATRLATAYGRRPSVEDMGWFVFGVLSAPAYRQRFGAALAIDHPRIPFPAAAEPFERMRSLGEELGRAHLLEAPVPAEVRFEGEGDGVVGPPRHDPDDAAVWINATQRFTGVPTEAWAWGGAFRPLEHFLTDRRGRRLDAEQIAMYQSAIWAVREAIRLAPALDGALTEVITATISLDPEAISVGFRSEDP